MSCRQCNRTEDRTTTLPCPLLSSVSVWVCCAALGNSTCLANRHKTMEKRQRDPLGSIILLTINRQHVYSGLSLNSVRVQCCFTSTETVQTIRDGEPRRSSSTFTQLLSSESLNDHALHLIPEWIHSRRRQPPSHHLLFAARLLRSFCTHVHRLTRFLHIGPLNKRRVH